MTRWRRAALGCGVAAITLGGLSAAATGMSPQRPYVAETQARYQPTLRNDQGVKAPHICPQRGYYFDEQGTRHPTGGACTLQFAPLTVRPGEWLSLRTARAAKRVVITPLDSANTPAGARACRPRYNGVWRCRMPDASPSDSSLRISIAYPKARGNWSADIEVAAAE